LIQPETPPAIMMEVVVMAVTVVVDVEDTEHDTRMVDEVKDINREQLISFLSSQACARKTSSNM
jgi:hypothetical protein